VQLTKPFNIYTLGNNTHTDIRLSHERFTIKVPADMQLFVAFQIALGTGWAQ